MRLRASGDKSPFSRSFYQRHEPLIPDSPPDKLEDQVVGNLIEEALEIQGCTPLVPVRHRRLRVSDGLMLALAAPKPEVGLTEIRLKDLRQYPMETLADHAVHHNGNSQFPLLWTTRLGDQDPLCRFETVCSGFQFVVDYFEKFLFAFREPFDRHIVYPRCSGVGSNLPPCPLQSPPVVDPFHDSTDSHFTSSVTVFR